MDRERQGRSIGIGRARAAKLGAVPRQTQTNLPSLGRFEKCVSYAAKGDSFAAHARTHGTIKIGSHFSERPRTGDPDIMASVECAVPRRVLYLAVDVSVRVTVRSDVRVHPLDKEITGEQSKKREWSVDRWRTKCRN